MQELVMVKGNDYDFVNEEYLSKGWKVVNIYPIAPQRECWENEEVFYNAKSRKPRSL